MNRIALPAVVGLLILCSACSAAAPGPGPVVEAKPTSESKPTTEAAPPPMTLDEELTFLTVALEEGHRDAAEARLLELRKAHPRNPEILVQLARVEYLRSVGGLSNRAGEPPEGWDDASMDHAQKLAEEAGAMVPGHANAWVVLGQIAWTRRDFEGSLALLDKAEALDPASVKLRLRKGTTLRSLAWYKGNDALLRQAAAQFEMAIRGEIDDGNERVAATELAGILTALGEHAKAEQYLTRATATASGRGKAFLLDARAMVRSNAGDIDGALQDDLDALSIMPFGVAEERCAGLLLVKGGMLVRDGKKDEAGKYFDQARQLRVDLERVAMSQASGRTTYAVLYGLVQAGLVRDFHSPLAARAFGEAAWTLTAKDVERLLVLGVDPDYKDSFYGTALHRAVAADNVEGVRALLAHGADPTITHPDGRTLLEQTMLGTSPERREVRKLVLAKVGRPAGSRDTNVVLPKKDAWYRVGTRMQVTDKEEWLQPGEVVQFSGPCRFTDRTDLCLSFWRSGRKFVTVSIPLTQLQALGTLKPVRAPTAEMPGAAQP